MIVDWIAYLYVDSTYLPTTVFGIDDATADDSQETETDRQTDCCAAVGTVLVCTLVRKY